MQQRSLWMRPALQKSEAVLMPALERRRYAEPRFSDRFTHVKTTDDPFRPLPQEGQAQPTLALSTYVRPRGSMAGRSVLRAAGMAAMPVSAPGRNAAKGTRRTMARSGFPFR